MTETVPHHYRDFNKRLGLCPLSGQRVASQDPAGRTPQERARPLTGRPTPPRRARAEDEARRVQALTFAMQTGGAKSLSTDGLIKLAQRYEAYLRGEEDTK